MMYIHVHKNTQTHAHIHITFSHVHTYTYKMNRYVLSHVARERKREDTSASAAALPASSLGSASTPALAWDEGARVGVGVADGAKGGVLHQAAPEVRPVSMCGRAACAWARGSGCERARAWPPGDREAGCGLLHVGRRSATHDHGS